jgi:hypothetical protein
VTPDEAREQAIQRFNGMHVGTIFDRLRAFWDEAYSARDPEVAALKAVIERAKAPLELPYPGQGYTSTLNRSRDWVHAAREARTILASVPSSVPREPLLTVRENPPMPTDEKLLEMFDFQPGGRIAAIRAIWRAGCDAGMVAP